ncbi:MAG: DUF58 domain-containing protein [Vicinamibacterales bacterium]
MLSADEVRQLDRLTFGNGNVSPESTLSGARIARVRGFSNEFQDLRPYQAGDDPRSIEWTVYGRLGQLVTRTYRSNAQLKVHVLLDISASMSGGVPDKLSTGAKLAALLGYVAIRAREAVGLVTFNAAITQRFAPATGRRQLFRIFAALSKVVAEGRSAIGASLMNYSAVEKGPGLVVVISDFFDANDVLQGFHTLQHRGLTPAVVQLLSADELDPSFVGDVELVDIETSDTVRLIADAESISAYRAGLDENRASLREFCDANALPFLQLTSSESFADMLRACASAGLFVGQP